jgi:glycosyltransferase involved in cell wall biosynthesis
MSRELLSIIMPAYNESKSLENIVGQVENILLPENFDYELIIVNDCSKDNTLIIANDLAKRNHRIKVINNEKNLGKSQAVRQGVIASTGDWVIVQDADLEYLPQEIADLLQVALSEGADVVYGNRFGKKNEVIYWKNYIGNRLLSSFSNIFTYPRVKTIIPDMEVCYKLMPGDIARQLFLGLCSTTVFGLEPEITAKLCRYKNKGKHLKFAIVPISYFPRSIAEGKKMKAFQDGFQALIEIIKFNLL